MFRAIVPRNCNMELGFINSMRGMKIDARPIMNKCRSPRQITKRCRSDLSPWSQWHSRSPFRNFDRDIGKFVNEMERSIFPWTSLMGLPRSGSARVWLNKKEFEVNVDVHHFESENIHVKLSNNRLTISGKHESKQDEHGYVSREFSREFTVPENVDAETMTSSITEEGVLVIRAKVKPEENPKDKTVNIEIERDNTSSGSTEDKKLKS